MLIIINSKIFIYLGEDNTPVKQFAGNWPSLFHKILTGEVKCMWFLALWSPRAKTVLNIIGNFHRH